MIMIVLLCFMRKWILLLHSTFDKQQSNKQNSLFSASFFPISIPVPFSLLFSILSRFTPRQVDSRYQEARPHIYAHSSLFGVIQGHLRLNKGHLGTVDLYVTSLKTIQLSNCNLFKKIPKVKIALKLHLCK